MQTKNPYISSVIITVCLYIATNQDPCLVFTFFSNLHGKDDELITIAASYGTTWILLFFTLLTITTSWLSSFVASADGNLLNFCMTVPLSMSEISEYTWIDRLKHGNIKLWCTCSSIKGLGGGCWSQAVECV